MSKKKERTIADIVGEYVQLRDSLREWQKQRDLEEQGMKAALTALEMTLLGKADELGVDSFKTSFGTAYKQIDEHYRIADWDQLVEFVKETGNFQVFQKRVTKTAVKEIYDEKGEVPPGLDRFTEATIHVLRSKRGVDEKGGNGKAEKVS